MQIIQLKNQICLFYHLTDKLREFLILYFWVIRPFNDFIFGLFGLMFRKNRTTEKINTSFNNH